jgi:hypothetical protein
LGNHSFFSSSLPKKTKGNMPMPLWAPMATEKLP